MRRFRGLLRSKLLRSLSAAAAVLAALLGAGPALADGGVAMSGSFYQQSFEIPQGSAIGGPDVYVVVFNNSNNQLKVRMTTQAPPGVSIVLSHKEFTLEAGGQQKILVAVEVSTDAAPGEYDMVIAAEPYTETVTGIALAGAASQRATLKVLGDAADVTVQAMSPDNQAVAATVRLYRIVSGQLHEVAYSERGSLRAKVAPGDFLAVSYVGGVKLAEEKFTVAKNDSRKITLTGATVYFEGFDVVPHTDTATGKLAFVQIVYTVRNLYQRVNKGEVFLVVSRDGTPLGETQLATLSPLETGRAGLNYNYIPTGGWTGGSYEFKLRLNLDGKPYASSLPKTLVAAGASAADGGAGGMNAYLILGIIAIVVVPAALAFFFLKKTRKKARTTR